MQIAARQWGALSHAQAIAAGLTPDQIKYRLLTGQWRRIARGVYVVAGTPDRWEIKVMIALLAGPTGTVASHLTAAALFGLAATRHLQGRKRVLGVQHAVREISADDL